MMEGAQENGDEVSIAVVNAPDPVVLLAAAMSFNEPLDELRVAASLHQKLHGKPLNLVRLDNGIAVPANAEYAMEARITLEYDDEGPYVDITGTVDGIRQEPVIRYDAVHHRNRTNISCDSSRSRAQNLDGYAKSSDNKSCSFSSCTMY